MVQENLLAATSGGYAGDLTTVDLLTELTGVAEANLARHLAICQDWMPHEYVPFGAGRDFREHPWEPGESALGPVAQIAFEVNLLTEDNLPSYHREILGAFGSDGVWATWANRWTAEEGRHAIVMRDYLLLTRGVDPDELERGRMRQLMAGYQTGDKPMLQVLAYVAFQELATRISHRNTGSYTDDATAIRLLNRVAADENLHMIFYRDLVTAALDLAPSQTVRAIAAEVVGFEMPGAAIQDFSRKAKAIARAGIYDLRIHHDQVLNPLLRHWRFWDRTGLDAAGEQARAQVRDFLDQLDALARRFEDRRATAAAAVGS